MKKSVLLKLKTNNYKVNETKKENDNFTKTMV